MDPQLQQILNQWASDPTSVKTWPPVINQQYTVEAWLVNIESGCSTRNVAEYQYVDAAIFFMRGIVRRIVVRSHQHSPLEWDMFKVIVRILHGMGAQLRQTLDQWTSNPTSLKTWPPAEDQQYSVEDWLDHINSNCSSRNIRRDQYVNVAILFLRGIYQRFILANHQHASLQWEDFRKLMLIDPTEILTKLAGTGLLAGGALAIIPSVGIAVLNAIGFTSSGVAAGSAAAAIQSAVYGGATGGLFSVCQSIGATAVVAPPVAIGLGIGAVVAGVGCFAYNAFKKRNANTAGRRND
ncbi:hypothetical protein VNI00_008140 [Paramarasmius palmivorus]|uniref:Uncharacterized protein n=1 Tax=Paramarasmius palmivorus TaxID=297713 RepID=A0AAW0CXH3_9AGAR